MCNFKYRILDRYGNVLEKNIRVMKIDIVLSDHFIFEVVDAYDLIPIIEHYRRKFRIPIYEHDISRAHYLHGLITFYNSGGVEGHEVDYFADTLRVINDWCAKYRRLYLGRFVDIAYGDFMMFCHHLGNKSCIDLPEIILKPVFTYVFCREHFSRHPNMYVPEYK